MSYATGLRAALLASSAIVVAYANPALAQSRDFNVPAGPAAGGITAFAEQADIQILVVEADTRGRQTRAVRGVMSAQEGLQQLLSGTGLTITANDGRTVTLSTQAPQGGSAGGDVDALIVTAQKREENIQDVPIAISAFSQEDLTRSQIAGGPDLITQVPNMTFTKTNFSSYSVQLRGIGTQAISATTDPAVAVAFNNTPFIRNRFFEQEFYDLQRVEVLRGPQGTLYGRNATAGVVNIISAKPKFVAESKLSADVSNFASTRVEGMVNIPLVEDAAALRIAGAWTKRDGYATNEITGNPIDGRDLWSTRVSLRFSPNDRLDANLIWEHFEEDDDRLRSGKQLCKKHVPTEIDGVAVPQEGGGAGGSFAGSQGLLSQGCIRTSLYSSEAFQTPNGFAVPFYHPLGAIGLPTVFGFDPYSKQTQSQDLRTIESTVDPDYRAKADLAELQITFDLSDSLTLTSETAYSVDTVWSLQDFNRFNTRPGAWETDGPGPQAVIDAGILSPDGVFCDPQIGCSDRLVAVDISTAEARQFSQEFRLSSDFDGAFNFSLGANWLRADSEDKYYVFINALTLFAAQEGFSGVTKAGGGQPYASGVTDNIQCMTDNGPLPGDPSQIFPVEDCIYIDPNPIGALNDEGHNYFLSKNPYKLISYAVFGEAYYQITDNLKLTGGLRFTVDKKEAPRVPSWTLAGQSYGYPVAEVIEQEWNEPTGRLTLDWKPELSFTDETMVYASYAHGYKAGGSNPPRFTYVFRAEAWAELVNQQSATRPKTFDPEFVDAFEVGSKNTMLDGTVTLNLAAFYYDYKDYQISEIVDRSAFNRNFDATVWGVELEADWRPLENLKFGLKGGYEKTRIADGEKAVDLMDRTAGNDDWVVVRPFPTLASSCILPAHLFVHDGTYHTVGNVSGGVVGGCEQAYILGVDPITGEDYVANPPQPNSVWQWSNGGSGMIYVNYPGFDPTTAPNNGEGFDKELGGNALPNAPEWTWTITGDYTVPLPNDWLATIHTDLHWQAESWWRLFQDHEFGKLDEYFTMNLAAIFVNEEAGWNVMAYIKNVTDETAITGAFLNSDDTGLTTNVFLTEPRLYGIRVTKTWDGGPLLGSFGERGDGPYPFTIEIGGQVQRHDASYDALRPSFAGTLSPTLDVLPGAQNQDLDWGDGRNVRVTWLPGRGPWKLTVGARYGRTNGTGPRLSAREESNTACIFGGYYAALCPLYADQEPYSSYASATNWSTAAASQREEHAIADFAVGRDLGIGVLADSSLAAGLRYARFKSAGTLLTDTVPDWYVPDGVLLPKYTNYATHSLFRAEVEAERSFEGLGPVLSWEAATVLLGGQDTGRVKLDWSVAGGVLFGKQETAITGMENANTYEAASLDFTAKYAMDPLTSTQTPINIRRSSDVTVPTFAASLGLSYAIDRISVGAGYRWERYFDAIDGGFTAEQSYDRTIDGPYFKIAVGFGG